MDTPEFSSMFFDMCAVYIPDFMNGSDTGAELDRMYNAIKYEYPNHRKLINEWWPNYSQELNNAKTWARNRTTFFLKHLVEFYKLGTMRNVSIDKGRKDDVKLTVNGIALHKRDFDGSYYEGRELRVSGVDAAGNPIGRWAVTVRLNGTSSTADYDATELKYTVPAGCESLVINSIPGSGGIDDVEADRLDATQPVEVYDIQGRSLGTHTLPVSGLAPGLYIMRQGKNVAKTTVR